MSEETATNYEELFRIALATASAFVSTSARPTIVDDIAAKAVAQYFEARRDRVEIDNPHGWITVAARRRALDEMRRWERDKKRNEPMDNRSRGGSIYFAELSHRLGAIIDDPSNAYEVRQGELWIKELFAQVLDDPVNRRIAWAGLIEQAKPREIAKEIGLDARVVTNRLVRIRKKLKQVVPVRSL